MIHDLNSLARAREREIRRAVLEGQRFPRPGRNRRSVIARMSWRIAGRLGTALVAVGKRLEGYEIRLLCESDYARG